MSKTRKWHARAIHLAVALALTLGLLMVPAAPASANDSSADFQVPGCLSEWGNANAEWDATVANVYYDTPTGGSAAKLTDGTSDVLYQQAAVLMCYDSDLASLTTVVATNYKYWIMTDSGSPLAAVIHVDTDGDGDVDVILHSTNIPCGDNTTYAADAPTDNWAAFNVNFSNPAHPFTGMGMWWKDGSGYTEFAAGSATYKALANWAGVGGVDQDDAVLYVGAATVGSYGPDVFYVDGIDITKTNEYDLEPLGCGPEYKLVPDINYPDITIAYNVKTAQETFTVIDTETGEPVAGCFVSNWQVTKRCGIGGITTLAGGNNGDNFVTVRMDTKGDCIITADVCGIPSAVRAEKKWGQIYCTKLESEKFFTNIYDVTETVTGSFLWEDCTTIEHLAADGAVVDWWLMDIDAQPAIEALEAVLGDDPCDDDGGCGTYTPGFFKYDVDGDTVDETYNSPRDALVAIYAVYDTLPSGNEIDPDVSDPDDTHETTTTDVDGKTEVTVTLTAPTSAILVTLTDYPIDLSGENPVCVQHETWVVVPPPVIEKLPDIVWAGEKDVIEWRLGADVPLDSGVVFYLEDPSVGTFEGTDPPFEEPTPPGIWAIKDTAYTTVELNDCDDSGVARVILHSDKQGKANVVAALLDDQYSIVAQQGFLVYFLAFEEVELVNLPDDVDNDEAWEEAGETTSDLAVDDEGLLRLRVKGYFTDPVRTSTHPVKGMDYDGDGVTDEFLPAGRWILPDDYPILADGALWQLNKPHWDIMDTPIDDIVSWLDEDGNQIETLGGEFGDYITYGGYGEGPCFESPFDDPALTWAQALAAYLEDAVDVGPVIGPFSKLEPATETGWDIDQQPAVPADGNEIDDFTPELYSYGCRTTVVPDGLLTPEDAVMPPAEILFVVTDGDGELTAVNKADLYYRDEDCTFGTLSVDGEVYTNPYYWQEIPANSMIPPMYGSGPAGYEWDSWDLGADNPEIDGPYRFWDSLSVWASDLAFARTLAGLSATETPEVLKVYTDNRGEAWAEFEQKAFDSSEIKAVASYPYLIGDHSAVLSNPVIKESADEKDIVLYVDDVLKADLTVDPIRKMLYVFVRNYDGTPATCEKVEWLIDGPYGILEALLEGTDEACTNACYPVDYWDCEDADIADDGRSAQSCTREMDEDEIDEFVDEDVFATEAIADDYAIAGVRVLSSHLKNVNLSVKIHDCWDDTVKIITEDAMVTWTVDDPAVEVGLVSIMEPVNYLVMVYGYKAGEGVEGWTVFNPDWADTHPDWNTLTTLHKNRGYWLNVNAGCTLTYETQTYELDEGWNLIGWGGA